MVKCGATRQSLTQPIASALLGPTTKLHQIALLVCWPCSTRIVCHRRAPVFESSRPSLRVQPIFSALLDPTTKLHQTARHRLLALLPRGSSATAEHQSSRAPGHLCEFNLSSPPSGLFALLYCTTQRDLVPPRPQVAALHAPHSALKNAPSNPTFRLGGYSKCLP